MNDPLNKLHSHFQRISRLDHALTFLHWDHMVVMPPGGSQPRAEAIAELTALRHQHLTSLELGELLLEAKADPTEGDAARSLLEMERAYQRAVCLPIDLVKARSMAGSICEHSWRGQRDANDWPAFMTSFEKVVMLAREEAQVRCAGNPGKFATPYDAMLDLYCTGDSSDFIAGVFVQLRNELPDLVRAVVEQQRGENPPDLHGHYPVTQQQQLGLQLMTILGFDMNRGRLDVSAHPFSTGCRGDQRITTRFRESDFLDALLAIAHETGHASYEEHLPEQWDGLPVGQARNLCLHESQSLLFEKQVFLSRPFMDFFTPILHRCLPMTGAIDSLQLWQAATIVKPSLIRVEADEVTYPLHVILRYEIEKDLINGSLAVADIPEIWDSKMREYLGLSTAGNYRDGCMQDMHWSDGSFGYFPSYSIGAVNSAQLFAAIRVAHPDWQDSLAGGATGFVRDWLNENIWSRGALMESQDLIRSATGQTTNADSFLHHLRQRYLLRLF